MSSYVQYKLQLLMWRSAFVTDNTGWKRKSQVYNCPNTVKWWTTTPKLQTGLHGSRVYELSSDAFLKGHNYDVAQHKRYSTTAQEWERYSTVAPNYKTNVGNLFLKHNILLSPTGKVATIVSTTWGGFRRPKGTVGIDRSAFTEIVTGHVH